MSNFLSIEHSGITDVGIKRPHNQDSFLIQPAVDEKQWRLVGHIFIVSDGMGGHAVGEKASAKAAQDIPLIYTKHVQDGPVQALRRAFQETNASIYAIGQKNPEFRGMGTTSTILTIREDGAWIGHVGDSRVYRFRNQVMEQLSFDHSYVWEMARRLKVPPEELEDVRKNVIIRSLGPEPLVQVDVEGPHPTQENDIFLLCSDGLSNLVKPEEMGAIIYAFPVQESAKILVNLANVRGGTDNITVLVVKILPSQSSALRSKFSDSPMFQKALRLWDKWNNLLNWSMFLLGMGIFFAILFVLSNINEWSNGVTWLIFTVLSVVLGLGGLVWSLREGNKNSSETSVSDLSVTNIYREYDCPIDQDLIHQFRDETIQLAKQVESSGLAYDKQQFNSFMEKSQNAEKDSDLLFAFREQLKAFDLLATVSNQVHYKEKGFQPKWQPPRNY